MGFNFGVAREVDGKLIYAHKDPGSKLEHAEGCRQPCMCAYGVDTSRHVGDREFFARLWYIPNKTLDFYPDPGYGDDPDTHLRPADFEAARELARKIAEERDTKPDRLLAIVDRLEKRPDIWLAGNY